MTCKKFPTPCPKDGTTQDNTASVTTPAFDICVGDYTLSWNGTHATVERTRTTADGTYGSITIQDGCVIGYGECEVPTYTPPYCNPNPQPCHEQTTPADSVVSPVADNQLENTPLGLFAKSHISAGDGIAVTGSGTEHDPYIIRTENVAGGTADSADVYLEPLQSETRNNVQYISLATQTGVDAGRYGPFEVNKYGVITKADPNKTLLTADGVQGIDEVITTVVADNVTVGLPQSDVGGSTTRLGGFDVTLSLAGRVTNIKQAVKLPQGRYKLCAYLVTLDEYGSVTAIEQSESIPQSAGSFLTADNKIVAYDETGRIVSVTNAPQGD